MQRTDSWGAGAQSEVRRTLPGPGSCILLACHLAFWVTSTSDFQFGRLLPWKTCPFSGAWFAHVGIRRSEDHDGSKP